MGFKADPSPKGKSQANDRTTSEKQHNTIPFTNNRPEAIQQKKRELLVKNSARVKQLRSFQEMANQYAKTPPSIQRKGNGTGLPGKLKSNIENLSGYSMDDVKVHYNSSEPAQLQAYGFTQGTNIHLASGQEQHLAHEACHVVQQKQGRVRPTMQFKKTLGEGMGRNDLPIQRKLSHVPIENLPNHSHLQQLITTYNDSDNVWVLAQLIDTVTQMDGHLSDAAKPQLIELIEKIHDEVGSRFAYYHQLNIPRGVNDAKTYQEANVNCALTSIAALLHQRSSDVAGALVGGETQFSDDFMKQGHTHSPHQNGEHFSGNKDSDRQINGMLDFIEHAFQALGFEVNITGKDKAAHHFMPKDEALARMRSMPTGTRFLVYVVNEDNTKGHWLYADRYEDQVYFFDYQVGRVRQAIHSQAYRQRHAGGTESPVAVAPPAAAPAFTQADLMAALARRGEVPAARADRSDLVKEVETHIPIDAPAHDVRPPQPTLEPAIPTYPTPPHQTTIGSKDAKEVFFITIHTVLQDRVRLEQKLRQLRE